MEQHDAPAGISERKNETGGVAAIAAAADIAISSARAIPTRRRVVGAQGHTANAAVFTVIPIPLRDLRQSPCHAPVREATGCLRRNYKNVWSAAWRQAESWRGGGRPQEDIPAVCGTRCWRGR